MLHQNVYRWSGFCVAAGSILLISGYWLRPYIEKQYVDDFANPSALLSSVLVGAGILLLLTGLPALFARQLQQTGTGGVVSAALVFIGLAAFHLGTLALYFVLPVLVTHSPETHALIYQDHPPFPRFAIFWAIGLLVHVVGLIWYSIKSWKAGVYPRAATLLMALGAVGMLAAPFLYFRLLQPSTTMILLGLVWCGISLITGTYGKNAQPNTTPLAFDRQKASA